MLLTSEQIKVLSIVQRENLKEYVCHLLPEPNKEEPQQPTEAGVA